MASKNREPRFDAENPEWTQADFARAKSADEGLPPEVAASFKKARGPQKTATKQLVSLRLSRKVLEHFRATGPGWQSRIDDCLLAEIERQSRGR